nr:MAG TPA: hypothetical protein [Caudoviricetes sp.]
MSSIKLSFGNNYCFYTYPQFINFIVRFLMTKKKVAIIYNYKFSFLIFGISSNKYFCIFNILD